MRLSKLIMALAIPLLSPIAAHTESTTNQDQIVGWLNSEISKSNYLSRFSEKSCETRDQDGEEVTSCSYKLTNSSYAGLTENKNQLFSVIFHVPVEGKDFDKIERETMYLFSMFIWGTMPRTSTYDHANELLKNIYDDSFKMEVAEKTEGNWSFAISNLKVKGCPFSILTFVAQDVRGGFSAFDVVSSVKNYGCAVLPSQILPK